MKRIMKLFGCILMVSLVLSLTSCGEDSLLDPSKPVQITIWHYYNSTQLVAFENMVNEFNQTVGKELGINVESFSQGSVNDLAQLVLDMAEGAVGQGGLPDIFAAYADTAYELKQLGVTADLSQYITDEELAEYVDTFWQEGCLPPDNVPTIFPMAKSTELLQIDQLAWKEFTNAVSGVDDSNLATWEGIVEAARIYYEYTDSLTPDVENDGRALFGIDSCANYLYTAMRQQGVTLLNNEGGKGVINLQEDALRKAFDIYYNSVVKGWFGHVGRYRSDDVKTGEIIGFIGSSTGSMYFPDVITYDDGTQKEADLASFAMPTFANGSPVVIQQGAGMVVTNSDEQREYASVVFLKWLTDVEQNLRFSTDSAYLPVKKEALYGQDMQDVLMEMENSDDYGLQNTAKVFRTVLDQLETHELYYAAPFEGLFEVRMVLESLDNFSKDARQELVALIDGGMSYDDAVDQLVNEAAFQEWLDYIQKNTAAYF